MQPNNGNKQQEESDDERDLDILANQNQEGMNGNDINLHPSLSKSIVNEQENTGFGKKVNEESQSNNPSLNFNGQNGNGLFNKDNNSENSKYISEQFIGQPSQQNNLNNQMNNFINK